MITVRFGATTAIIKNMTWATSDKELLRALNALIPYGGSSGADPNRDLTAATEAAKVLHGRIIEIVQVPEPYRKNVVY